MVASHFFITDRLKKGTVAFEGSEFHHMVRVTLHQVGDTVLLVDGTGAKAEAKIEYISRDTVTMEVGDVVARCDGTGLHLSLVATEFEPAMATILIEKAVELGVTNLILAPASQRTIDSRRMKVFREIANAASRRLGRARQLLINDDTSWDYLVPDGVSNAAITAIHIRCPSHDAVSLHLVLSSVRLFLNSMGGRGVVILTNVDEEPGVDPLETGIGSVFIRRQSATSEATDTTITKRKQ